MDSAPLIAIARKARGVLGMALTWGMAWVPVSVALLPIYLRTWAIGTIDPRAVIAMAVEGFVLGALNGAAFSLVLAAVERRRRLGDLRSRRIAWYGTFAGGAIATIVTGIANVVVPHSAANQWFLVNLAIFSALGGASGAASLALARRGLPSEGTADLGQLSAAPKT